MTIDNPIKYEKELVEMLWSMGYASFRVSPSGPESLAECDVVAMKQGDTVVLNVVVLESGASTRKVGDKCNEMIKIKRRADPTRIGNDCNLIIGHAIKKDFESEWYYADLKHGKLRGKKGYKKLNEVMPL